MMFQMQQPQNPVSPELQALMTLMQGAQKGTVQPQADGVPTVAQQVMTQAAGPTLQKATQQGGIAAGIGAQQQAGAQQEMMKMAQQMQQQKQQQPLLGGVAQAPGAGGMRFAGGGIVGYAGDDESFVESGSGGGRDPRDMSESDRMLFERLRRFPELLANAGEGVKQWFLNIQEGMRGQLGTPQRINPAVPSQPQNNPNYGNEGLRVAQLPPENYGNEAQRERPLGLGGAQQNKQGIAAAAPRGAGVPSAPNNPVYNDAAMQAEITRGRSALDGMETNAPTDAEINTRALSKRGADVEYLKTLGLDPDYLKAQQADSQRLTDAQIALLQQRTQQARGQQTGLPAVASYLQAVGQNRYNRGNILAGAGERFNATMAGHEKAAQGNEDRMMEVRKLANAEQFALTQARHAAAMGDKDKALALIQQAQNLRNAKLKLQSEFSEKVVPALQQSAGTQYQGAVQMRNQDAQNRTQIQVANIGAAARGAGGESGLSAKETQAQARLLQAINGDPALQGYKKRLEAAFTEKERAAVEAAISARVLMLMKVHAPELAEKYEAASKGSAGADGPLPPGVVVNKRQ